MKQERIEWIDIAKGMAIFLMVCGHTSIPSGLSNWIWSFHMPLFFIVSGMLFCPARYPAIAGFVRKRCVSLLVPWGTFTAIALLCSPSDSLRLLGEGRNLHALWFLPVLFTVEILGYYVARIGGKITTAIIIASAGFVMERCGIRLPFNIEVSLYATFFYIIGYVGKRKIAACESTWLYIVSLLAMNIFLSQVLPRTDMAGNKIGIYGVNAMNAFIGTMAFFLFAKKMEKWSDRNPLRKYFVWAGKNTLVILGLSQVINLLMKDAMEHLCLPGVVNSVLRHMLLWCLLWLIAGLIDRYVPELIGKQRRK